MFEYLANNSTWTENSVTFANADVHTYFKFMREAVMDAHLRTRRVVGFAVGDDATERTTGKEARHAGTTTVTRNSAVGESYVELSNIMKHLLFVTDIEDPIFSMRLGVGANTLDNNSIMHNVERVNVLSTDPYICNCTRKNTILWIITGLYSGFKSMYETSKLLPKNQKYFPMNISFDLNEYVRILPIFGDSKVHYTLLNGMTPEILSGLFTDYITYLNRLPNESEEKQWAQNLLN